MEVSPTDTSDTHTKPAASHCLLPLKPSFVSVNKSWLTKRAK